MVTKFKCVVCGKVTAGRLPKINSRHKGDGTERYPRRHKVGGKPCPGNIEHADWIDTPK